ncbi:hypothetical protein [Paracidovorax avenae]|uniref:hypothetical protein n=1 Tax=Paracidovorax avenae TaxID=80867 RepID=UPI000D2173AA|nr:hypothetical protein [Paracidovorax avenae]AVT07338.1 hypothetical protein C8248_16190 [Paracidovorax avenae]
MGCINSTSRTSSPPRASRARDSDHTPARQTGGTRTMTAYPDESLGIRGRAAGGVGLQRNRETIASINSEGMQLLRDTRDTLGEHSPLRAELRELLGRMALHMGGRALPTTPQEYRQALDSIRRDIDQHRADNPTPHELEGRAAYAMAFHDENFEQSTLSYPTGYDMNHFSGR